MSGAHALSVFTKQVTVDWIIEGMVEIRLRFSRFQNLFRNDLFQCLGGAWAKGDGLDCFSWSGTALSFLSVTKLYSSVQRWKKDDNGLYNSCTPAASVSADII